ncbi:hypothetical protein BH11BAC3_BH11BAC3_46540 [soil metagenome]
MTKFAEMNTGANNFSSPRKSSFYSAVLFLLAVMILVVSCPLKKLLQNNYTSGSSLPLRTNSININQRSSNDHSVAMNNCYAANDKIVLTKSHPSQQVKLPAGSNLFYISIRAGIGVNYFLNSTQRLSGVTVSTHRSDLPLFLQHLRLLI